MTLNDATLRLIAELRECDFFSRIGLDDFDTNVPRANSWPEAVKFLKSKRYWRVVHEAKNVLTEQLARNHKSRCQQWNSLVDLIKPLFMPTVDERVGLLGLDDRAKNEVVNDLNWFILLACMELEYADLIPPRFGADHVKWLRIGHLPCGWVGGFPDGGHFMIF